MALARFLGVVATSDRDTEKPGANFVPYLRSTRRETAKVKVCLVDIKASQKSIQSPAKTQQSNSLLKRVRTVPQDCVELDLTTPDALIFTGEYMYQLSPQYTLSV